MEWVISLDNGDGLFLLRKISIKNLIYQVNPAIGYRVFSDSKFVCPVSV